MASTPLTYSGEEESTQLPSTPIFRPSSSARRTPSFSSASPSDSCDSSSFRSLTFSLAEEFPPFSPISTPLKFKGIPFSWEKLPGIPKNQLLGPKKKAYSEHLLPLPPAATTSSAAKKLPHQEEISPKKSSRFVQRDPFFAALVECSKDDHDDEEEHDHHHHGSSSSKITRTLSDRFGFISMYSSCKRSCAVSESLVYLPRPSPHYLLNRRSS